MQEVLLVLLIALILWPKPILGAARWLMRHAFGTSATDEPAEKDGTDDGSNANHE
jgi:hypothetical protein